MVALEEDAFGPTFIVQEEKTEGGSGFGSLCRSPSCAKQAGDKENLHQLVPAVNTELGESQQVLGTEFPL